MRGRGRGRGRGRTDFGVPRHELVTEEQPPYPDNPKLECAGGLITEEEQLVVAANRLLLNYLKFESPFQVRSTVRGRTTRSGVQPAIAEHRVAWTSTDEMAASSAWGAAAVLTQQQQKDAICALTAPDYFPVELLLNEYLGGRGSRRPLSVRRMPSRVEAVQEGGEERAENEDDEVGDEEPEDFGGDDYAQNHEADDDFDDGNDGGGDNDDTF